jgi:hypothetical protein
MLHPFCCSSRLPKSPQYQLEVYTFIANIKLSFSGGSNPNPQTANSKLSLRFIYQFVNSVTGPLRLPLPLKFTGKA